MCVIPKTRFPFFIHDATRMSSYASYCDSTSPESISQTIAVLDLSTLTTRVAMTSLILSTEMMVTSSLWRTNRRSAARESCCRQRIDEPWAWRRN